jgi:hypothetical protein
MQWIGRKDVESSSEFCLSKNQTYAGCCEIPPEELPFLVPDMVSVFEYWDFLKKMCSLSVMLWTQGVGGCKFLVDKTSLLKGVS